MGNMAANSMMLQLGKRRMKIVSMGNELCSSLAAAVHSFSWVSGYCPLARRLVGIGIKEKGGGGCILLGGNLLYA